MPASRVAPRRLSTQAYLLCLVAAVVLPLLAFAGFLLTRYAATEQARFERDALQNARQIALVIDGELAGLVALLKGLASSSALERGDLAGFHAEAKRLVGERNEIVVLREFGPRQLLNTQRPFGAELPPAVALSPAEQAAFAAGRPLVSDIYRSPLSGEPRIAVALPILRSGAPPYVLALTVPTTRIRDALMPAVPPGWIIGVGDREGIIVTRSARHDEISGRPGVPEYLAQAVGRSGTFFSTNFEGTALLAGYHRSDFSGWLYAANVPQAVVEAPLRRSLLLFAAVGTAALGLSALLAYLFGTSFAAATTGLAERARALGAGRPVPPLSTHLTELAVVGDALGSAAAAVEERERERERTIEREALLGSIFDAAGLQVGIAELLEDDFRYVVANHGAAALFGRSESGVEGTRASELGLSRDEIRSWLELCRRCIDAGEPITAEYGMSPAGAPTSWHLATFTPLPPDPSGARRVAFTAIDITERRRGEEQRRLLIHELNHRVKNTLATVQSIALQTLRGATSMPEARDALTERLIALARAHDVLTSESWEGAELHDIVAGAIGPHAGRDRFRVHGPPVRLSPGLSLSLALALHELATNAAKYGALSTDAGSVEITWQLANPGGAPHLRLRWVERGGPPVSPPLRQGFGSRLIQRSLSTETGGSATIDYAPEGVVCTMEAPIGGRGAAEARPAA